jgi:MFS family permease
LLWGLLAGSVADRFNRKRLLILSHLLLATLTVLMGFLVSRGGVGLWHALAFTFLVSSLSAFATTARQALVVDLAGRGQAMQALSINGVVMRATGVLGGVASGAVIAFFQLSWVFYLVAGSFITGAAIMLMVPDPGPVSGEPPPGVRSALAGSLRIITGNRAVLALVLLAIVCEILGFSWQVLLPVFARDILSAGAQGLGILTSTQSLGGVLAVLGLAILGNFRQKGHLILAAFLLFGVFLLLFAASPWFFTSVILCGLIGGMAAAFDTLEHTMLQLRVSEVQRGRAMGIWLLSIGFGPVGSLAVGAMADALGARLALGINGSLMILIFSALLLFARYGGLSGVTGLGPGARGRNDP